MKTRNSLVSNSSSSSFVIVGYKFKYNHKDKQSILDLVKKFDPNEPIIDVDPNYLHDYLYTLSNDTKRGYDILLDGEDSTLYVGSLLANVSSNEYGLDNKELNLSDIVSKCNIVKEQLGLNEEPKIFIGTKAC